MDDKLTNLYTAVKEAIVATALLDGVGGDFVNPGADLERLQASVVEAGYMFRAHKLVTFGDYDKWFAIVWPQENDLDSTICKISSNSAEYAFLDAIYVLIHSNHFKSHRITR